MHAHWLPSAVAGLATRKPLVVQAWGSDVELAKRLATSSAVRDCMQKQWFRFSLGRLEGDEDFCSMQKLSQEFAASDYDVKALLLGLVTSDAFRYRKVQP